MAVAGFSFGTLSTFLAQSTCVIKFYFRVAGVYSCDFIMSKGICIGCSPYEVILIFHASWLFCVYSVLCRGGLSSIFSLCHFLAGFASGVLHSDLDPFLSGDWFVVPIFFSCSALTLNSEHMGFCFFEYYSSS